MLLSGLPSLEHISVELTKPCDSPSSCVALLSIEIPKLWQADGVYGSAILYVNRLGKLKQRQIVLKTSHLESLMNDDLIDGEYLSTLFWFLDVVDSKMHSPKSRRKRYLEHRTGKYHVGCLHQMWLVSVDDFILAVDKIVIPTLRCNGPQSGPSGWRWDFRRRGGATVRSPGALSAGRPANSEKSPFCLLKQGCFFKFGIYWRLVIPKYSPSNWPRE